MDGFNDFNNARVAALPAHLKRFIVAQHYEHYTPIDQAVWRYVMRQNYHHLKDVAYYPYIPGLAAAGLSIEKIPDLQEMNDALGKIGWGAVTVNGFIPPAAFMEFQACQVLVIAADIRTLQHIEYTPAPDIIHESAGHAPIIADTAYREYLSYFGSIGTKAMYSAQDLDLYEAIRQLSILKEMPDTSESKIKKAEDLVQYRQNNMGEPSEMALLSRLHWWTVEYGLIGTLENPKIYGAGLLSSIGESASCMQADVKKLWYTIDAVNYPYDITQPQPQLFVTPNFQNLIDVLEEFANSMAFRKGGAEGLKKAIESKHTCTAVYSSGLQVSGMFTSVDIDKNHQPYFVRTSGPTVLAANDKQLEGQGIDSHPHGFSSPVGLLKGFAKPLEEFTKAELSAIGIELFSFTTLVFESGISLRGRVRGILYGGDKLQLITFDHCTVKGQQGEMLFDPSFGVYDMAIGSRIVSVFSGAADKASFDDITSPYKKASPIRKTDNGTKELNRLYQEVRNIRQGIPTQSGFRQIWEEIKIHHPNDWLCSLEILELLELQDTASLPLIEEIGAFLEEKAATKSALKKLICDGLALIEKHEQSCK